jgi:hypothetical protein
MRLRCARLRSRSCTAEPSKFFARAAFGARMFTGIPATDWLGPNIGSLGLYHGNADAPGLEAQSGFPCARYSVIGDLYANGLRAPIPPDQQLRGAWSRSSFRSVGRPVDRPTAIQPAVSLIFDGLDIEGVAGCHLPNSFACAAPCRAVHERTQRTPLIQRSRTAMGSNFCAPIVQRMCLSAHQLPCLSEAS